jgi:hypothetical protein
MVMIRKIMLGAYYSTVLSDKGPKSAQCLSVWEVRVNNVKRIVSEKLEGPPESAWIKLESCIEGDDLGTSVLKIGY